MWSFFVRHRQFTTVIALAIALIGVVSTIQIPKESNPEISIPIIVVSTPFPGANAVDVESFVTDKVEDAVLGLEDIDEVTSSSSLGISSVVVSFNIGVDAGEKRDAVQEAVDTIQRDLPTDAEDPIVASVSFDDRPIKVYALGGPYPLEQINEFAEEIQDELERIPGVANADIIGGADREVRVLVDPRRLDQFDLSLSQVTAAISRANSNIPVGTIETAEQEYSVRFEGRITHPDQLAGLPIAARNGATITVGDVSQIIDGYTRRTSSSKLSTDRTTATPSVSMNLVKSDEGNILDVVDAADAVFARAAETYLPSDVSVEVVDDDAQFIRDDLRNLSLSGLQTTLIVIVLILVFLGWRESLLAGITIPLTFLITFAVLQFIGFTLNFLTLFSLILSLGILVDGSIVMTEGLHANVEKGLSPLQAALQTIKEFKAPLISGTLTTVFAFVPMLLSSGLIGEFIKSIPVTVSIVLFASLFVALALIPTFGSRLLTKRTTPPKRFVRLRAFVTRTWQTMRLRSQLAAFRRKRELTVDRMRSWYVSSLSGYMNSIKSRKRLMRSLIVGLVLSISLPVVGVLQVDMFPATDLDRLYIDVALPTGTPLATTEASMAVVEEAILADERVESYLISSGTGSPLRGGSGSHFGSAVLNLVDLKDRIDSRDMLQEIEADLAPQLPLATVEVSQLSSGPDTAFPVEVLISGPELEELEALATQFEQMVTTIPGARNVKTSIDETAGEFVFEVNRDAIARYGLSTFDVASELRTAVFGATTTTIKTTEDDLDVIVKYRLTEDDAQGTVNRVTINQLTAITIQTASGDIPLSSFLNTRLAQSRASISHEGGDRVVRVTSATTKNTPASLIFQEIREQMRDMEIPDGYEVSLGGQDESTQESFTDLYKAMIIGIFLIGALLVLQFKSYRQPLFVLASIPLSLIGVLPGLALIGVPLSFPGMIGIVALAGIVVNNGIILVDRINENRRRGLEKDDAVREAASTRLRPIILTTITTVAGLLPLVLTQPSWAPLGFAIIFGLMFSTILTLYVVPLLYQKYAEKELN